MLLKTKIKYYENLLVKFIEKKLKNLIFNYRNTFKIKLLYKINKNIKNILEIFSGESKITYIIIKKLNWVNSINIIDIFKNNLKKSKNLLNYTNLKLKFFKKNITKNFKKTPFDLLIINPPYIPYKNKNIKTKIKFEPIESLTDFKNGYYFYKKIKYLISYIKFFKYILVELNKEKIINLYIKNFKIINVEKN